MTRKHFQAIAKTFAEAHTLSETDPATLLRLASMLADTFGSFNPRFDRSRFIRACQGIS